MLAELGELLGIEFGGQRLGEIAGRLRFGVAQVVGPQLDEPAVGPQAGEWQRRVLPREQDEMHERRPVLDQEADEAVDRLGRDELVIIERQHERVVARGDLIKKRSPDQIDAGADTGAEEAQHRLASVRPDRPKRRHEVANETGEIVVGGIEREPSMSESPRRQPAGDGDRLAVPRRSGQERQACAVLEPPVEEPADPRTLTVSRDRDRRVELRPDDRDCRLGVSRCGRQHRPDYRWP